ncbi:putative ATP-dependent RNA helicase kurz isoform X1 [Dermacentor variabilis]|uniref:putative ATP-dependent RNA helicase kurz isoform X1 n=1 Tax=Dermacentor variabilis TaxID=34621 RepID=UPI003F5BB422
MGRSRRKYDAKARSSQQKNSTDNEKPSEVGSSRVEVELDVRQDKYDSSNALVLPSKKAEKKEANKVQNAKVAPKLSKKKKKLLQKILEKKNKKINRAHLLEELQKSQASQKELSMLISTSAMQTKGLKRLSELTTAPQPHEKKGSARISSVKGSRQMAPKRARIQRDDVLGFESESSVSEDSMADDDESPPSKEGSSESQTTVEMKENEEDEATENPESDAVTESATKKTDKDAQAASVATPEENKQQPPTKPVKHSTPSVFMPVHRTEEIQKARHQLPILAEEQRIMEAIAEHDVLVICGQTGSGKTTQVPQFLYEAGYTREKMVGITEPRRVAAVSMSKRVAEEMSLSSSEVSYQIRFEGNVTGDTKIKFMTDGVLLKEIQNNFLLTGYSVIIIDEAHERSIYSDILIGLLSRIVPLRRRKGSPLKLIIMSATLRVEDFTQNTHLFKKPPPVIKVDSRQHPVTIHFNKRTPDDYMHEAYRKVCKIHQQLPEGGILVFVTGQQEVLTLCRKLKKRFPENPRLHGQDQGDPNQGSSEGKEAGGIEAPPTAESKTKGVNLDDYSVVPLDEGQLEELVKDSDREDGDLSSSEDDDLVEEVAPNKNVQPLTVLPLFSLLPSEKQAKVFQAPPEGTRLCVVATNVGETSLTIPNVKYVVDSGKVKMRVYDKVTGISAFLISWVSKASADQRAGRAGRTCPGHCYRLYSSAVFNDEFQKFTPPEITRRPVEDLVLQMKAMNIDKVVNFPYPSPPDKEALKAAEKKLVLMGALEELPKPTRFKDLPKWEWSARITPLGRAMSCFPVSPRYAKMLALSHQHGLLPYIIAVVAAMTVQEVFISMGFSSTEGDKQDKQAKWKKVREMWAGQGHSLALGDVMVLLKAVGASEFVGCTAGFCESHGLRYKAMVEIRKLRVQLTNELNLLVPNLNLSVDPAMEPPTDLQAKLIRQVLVMGFSDHIAKKMTDEERCSQTENAIAKNAYKSMEVDGPVFIHPNSVLSSKQPPFVLYQEIFETTKMFMRVVAEVEPEWLPVYAPKYCTFSSPLEDPPPRYDRKKDKLLCSVMSTFGPHTWQMEAVEQEFPEGLDKFRWFARFLLQGDVLPFFKKYNKLLLSPPITMIKSWARLQPRTEHLLQALVSQSADSRHKLHDLWDREPKYLLKEYLEWIQESLHNEVALAWPPKPK